MAMLTKRAKTTEGEGNGNDRMSDCNGDKEGKGKGDKRDG
jgi:hypothetical protein